MRLGKACQVGQLCRQSWIRTLSTSSARGQMCNAREFPKDFPAQFDPALVERWYAKWEADGAFRHGRGRRRPGGKKYNMLLPPPNVTGKLHVGHALTVAQEDALCRWRRLCGDNVQYVPGTDHAGIATQSLVERLLKERGVDVAEMSREERLQHVHRWKDEHGDHIVNQLRKLGISGDWTEQYFTLDKQRAEAVTQAFIRLFNQGLMYRRVRFANWCCHLKTVISNIEIDEEHYDQPTDISVVGYDGLLKVGLMHHVAYPLETGGEMMVATTRPETIPADAALAVHPDDLRYTHLHNTRAINPVTNKFIPIICDDILVNMEKGTGVVKVTPCHDPRDYECGLRHDLPQEVLFAEDGTMSLSDGDRVHRFAGRQLVLSSLQHKGLYRGSVTHPMVVQRCSRSGDIIEPVLYPQWFLRMGDFCKHAMNAVDSGELRITPSHQSDVWKRWLSKEQDWCVSRQLYWGHRIPAWRIVAGLPNQTSSDGEQSMENDEDSDDDVWVVGVTEEEAKQSAIASHSCDPAKVSVVQEEDVLDTWFSSALLPLSTAGWPASEVSDFYPLSVMETGGDILFFWVARMYMLCSALHPSKQPPFSHVLLHPLIKDASGAKMSKSKGNVVDPLDVMNGASYEKLLGNGTGMTKHADKLKDMYPDAFPACGADSLRFFLNKRTLSPEVNFQNIDFDVYDVVLARNFCTKLWNGVRFAYMIWPQDFEASRMPHDPGRYSLLDCWIMNTAARFLAEYERAMDEHRLGDAATQVQVYVRDHLCTQYFQLVKVQGEISETQDILYHTLCIGLQAAHPFMPFITEDLWQRLPHPKGTPKSILDSCPPKASELAVWVSDDLGEKKALLQMIANAGKATADEFKPTVMTLCTTVPEHYRLFQENHAMLEKYFFVKKLIINAEMPSDMSSLLSAPVDSTCGLFVAGNDVRASTLYQTYTTRLQGLQNQLERLNTTMTRPMYAEKVPAHIQERDGSRADEVTRHIAALEHSLSLLPKKPAGSEE